MFPYLIYLFEVSVCLLILYLFYKVFLEGLTFYQVRRFFLIFSVALSFLIPSLNVKITYFHAPVSTINRQIFNVKELINQPENTTFQESQINVQSVAEPTRSDDYFGFEKLVALLYLLGMAFLLTRLVHGLFELINKVRKSQSINLHGMTVYQQSTNVPACSFFKYIFVNPKLFTSEQETLAAIDHELVHVRQRHSLDLLFFELAKIILWFNPLIYLTKKEIGKVHEFQADQHCVERTERDFYSRMLLKHARFDRQPGLVHSFALLPLKFRIKELFKAQSPKRSVMRLAFLIPVVCGLFLTFSCSDEFFGDSVFPNGKRLKSVKVVYHDEYGDMPQYDGQYYSWAKFDRSGEITELKKGTFHEIASSESSLALKDLSYRLLPDDNIAWQLDYQSYGYLITLLFNDPNAFARARVKGAMRLRKFNDNVDLNIAKNDEGLPVEISTTIRRRFGRERSSASLQNKEIFLYGTENRLIKWENTLHATQVDDQNIDHSYSRTIEYNPFGKVSKIIADDLGYQLTYDEKGNISEVNMGNVKYTYQYDEYGIRTESFAYNPNGELEYSLDYEYEFY